MMLDTSDTLQPAEIPESLGNILLAAQKCLLPVEMRSDELVSWVLQRDSHLQRDALRRKASSRVSEELETAIERVAAQFLDFFRSTLIHIGRRWAVSELALKAVRSATEEDNLLASIEQTQVNLRSAIGRHDFGEDVVVLVPQALRRILEYGEGYHRDMLAVSAERWQLWRKEVLAFQNTYFGCQQSLSAGDVDGSRQALMSLLRRASGKSRLRESLEEEGLQLRFELSGEEFSATLSAVLAAADSQRENAATMTEQAGPSAMERRSPSRSTPRDPVRVSVINASTVLNDSEIEPVVEALQEQVKRDFQPAWGIDAELSFVPLGEQPPADTWWLGILDDSDQAGALGYHDLTTAGLPLGKIFAGTDLKYGYNWSITASHELLEMLADPNINLTVLVQTSDTAGRLYAYEVCDACEADQFGYNIGGVTVSDFVYPSWFEDFRPIGSAQFDQQNLIEKPFDLLEGGYIGAFDLNSGSGWYQVTPAERPTSMLIRGNVGSRRERRGVPRHQWLHTLSHKQIMSRTEQYLHRVGEIQRRRHQAA
jgi:hypothetical protein